LTRTYDIVVLGGGPGGYVAAIRAAQLGKSVAVVEKAKLGGVCLHKGCIPSKALLRSAEVRRTVLAGAEFGVTLGEGAAPSVDFGRVQSRKTAVVDELHRGLTFLMKKHKIDVVSGTGRLMGPTIFSPQTGTVAVETPDGESVTLVNERLILATGSRPRVIPGLEPDGTFVLTSDEALELEALPASLAIVGGGIIGVEWASMMADFGVEVTVVEAADRLLPTEDEDVSREMAAALRKRGVTVLTGAAVDPSTLRKREAGAGAQEVRFEAERGGERVAVAAEAALVAVGRVPNVEGIGLENTNVALERGAVRVNGWMQTSEPHIYAIGDVAGGMQMAHAASHQGVTAVEHICGVAHKPFDSSLVPRCVFSHPEVASIGLTERQAKEAGYRVKTGKMPFRAVGKSLVYGEPEGFVKVVADAATNDVLGVHMIGAKATELIGEASLAKLLEATPWEIGAAIHPHPTLSEALGEAALAVDGRALGL